jgi:hypothetical protein
MLVTVPIILDQAVDYCFHFLSVCWSLFLFFSDQDVGYCSGDFGSGCWLLFPLFWTRLLVKVPMILDQVVGYSSSDFGFGC